MIGKDIARAQAKGIVDAGLLDLSPETKAECQQILDAVIEYNLSEVRKKMEIHGVDFDLALQMQMAVMAVQTYPR